MRDRGSMVHPLQFLNLKMSSSFSSNIGRDIAFYGCLEIKLKRSFAIFIVYATIFWQFTVAFHFFLLHKKNRSLHAGPSEKVWDLTLDLSNWHATSRGLSLMVLFWWRCLGAKFQPESIHLMQLLRNISKRTNLQIWETSLVRCLGDVFGNFYFLKNLTDYRDIILQPAGKLNPKFF